MALEPRRKILNQNDYPWNCICFLEIYYRPNGANPDAIGTGTLIAPRTVLTALHNLYKGKYDEGSPNFKGIVDRIRVSPGGKGSKFGSVLANSTCFRFSKDGKFIFDNYNIESQQTACDYGAIVFPPEFAFVYPPDFLKLKIYTPEELPTLQQTDELEVAGYPYGERPDLYGKLFAQRGRIIRAELKKLVYNYELDDGDSGGPIFLENGDIIVHEGQKIRRRFVIGIHSRRIITPVFQRWGRRISSDLKEEILKWIKEGGASV